MSNYLVTDTELTGVANKIRTKGGTNSSLSWPTGYESAIEAISTGTDVSDTTAAAGDVLSGKYFYTAAGVKTQGTITEQSAQTIMPTTSDQTIASGKYLSGTQTIKGDVNLVAENIKKDISLFGVTGSYEGEKNNSVWQDENGYIHIGSGKARSTTRKDVNFYDYDGTIIDSFTTEEFANITALATNPTHTGLTAQGWNMPSNWSLADAKTYIATNKKADWGQMYVTDDGKTRVYIHLEEGRLSPMLGCCPNGTVDVDWGDGTAHDTLTGTSTSTVKWTSNHTYAAAGDYVIKLTVTGSMGLYGSSSSSQNSGLLRYSSSADTRNKIYQNAVRYVEIGSSLTIIGSYAFNNCYSLTSITTPNNLTNIAIGAFNSCYKLTSITIPNSVTTIAASAFYNCYNLASIMIPSGVTQIENSVFSNCQGLTSVTIPNGVTNISNYAFSNCYSLTNITIPSSVTNIGVSAFQACYNLISITIPSGVTGIGSTAFNSCYRLISITIPDSIRTIGEGAFYNCYNLTSITIPSNITRINNTTFYGCYSLTSVTISSGVTSIHNSAFYDCNCLMSITIPNSVTSIGNGAFSSCYGLGELHFKSETPPTVTSGNTFSSIPTDCIIYVPTGKLSAYTSASNYPSSSTYTYVEE